MYTLENQTFQEGNSMVCQNCGRESNTNEKMKKSSIIYPITGWFFMILSFVFLPLFFGSVAIFMSIITYLDRSRVHGTILMILSIFGIMFGSLLSIFVTGTMFI